MKVVSLIPIKLNSSRLPKKNILPLLGHPLCWHICNTMNRVKNIDDVYVFCSDPIIMDYIPKETKFLKRPQWLDGDEVKGVEIYREFVKTVDADIYVLAHTTSPFIRVETCEAALNKMLYENYDSSFTAERIQTFSWFMGKPINYELIDVKRTQDLEPVWIETSGFYMFRKEVFTKYNRRIGFKPYVQEVFGIEALDIDEKKDYDVACLYARLEGSE